MGPIITFYNGGQSSVICIATRCETNGPGIENRWMRDFSVSVDNGAGVYPASSTMATVSFPLL